MVQIRPFRALRYNPDVVGELSRVIAPPYDIIDATAQEQLHQRSAYNVVRLILGKQCADDTERNSRYTRARHDFDAWCQSGALRTDDIPALYLIEHTFSDHGTTRSRLGFIALLGLDDETVRSVYRHEATLAAPKADRTKLLEAVPANLSPIFCVYPDAGGTVQMALQRATKAAPVAEAALANDTVRVWALTDPALIQQVQRHLATVAVLIADGHHRFEVACAKRAQYPAVMAYLVSMEDPALVMRPIHRILQHPGGIDGRALRERYEVEPVPHLDALTQWLSDRHGQGRFGWYDGHALSRVTVTDAGLAQWRASPAVAPALAMLDVSLLHGLILPKLGVCADSIRYTASSSDALASVDKGEGTGAWLLRGIPLAEVFALASKGLTLPPKSTYFYPKVLSGLTINPHINAS